MYFIYLAPLFSYLLKDNFIQKYIKANQTKNHKSESATHKLCHFSY
jgi:hypothetical protein